MTQAQDDHLDQRVEKNARTCRRVTFDLQLLAMSLGRRAAVNLSGAGRPLDSAARVCNESINAGPGNVAIRRVELL
jgi:hypothetical protein